MFVHCPPKQLVDLNSETQPDGKRYYVTPDGKKLPSVTTVVGAMKKQAIMEWRNRVGEAEANRISKLATGRGNRVHLLAEKYLNNEPIQWAREMPDAVEMFRTLIKPIHSNITNIWYQEQALFSLKMEMAGRVDLIAHWNGKLSIIDFKTSKRVKDRSEIEDYFWQECAYALMLEEMLGQPVDQLVTLMAVEDSEPLIFVEKTEDHIEGLVNAIKFYRQNS